MTGETKTRFCLPCNYSGWLDCFSKIQRGEMSACEIEKLKDGTCEDYNSVAQYFPVQLEQTVNFILNQSIKAFKRKMKMQSIYNRCDDIHLVFNSLIKDSERCLFFMGLEFLSEEYRDALFANVKSEMQRFLDTACRSLSEQCIRENNMALYDEIRLIKRIKLYRGWEKVGL